MKRSATRRLWRIVVSLFVLALLSRLGVALALGLHRTQLRAEVHKIALSLAKGRGFSDPYLIPTGPTAHQAPLYPVLLAGVYVLLGSGQAGQVGEYVLDTLAIAAVYAMLPLVALALRFPLRVGITASLLGILVPAHFLVELRGGEYGFCALALIILFLATAKLWHKEAFELKNGILHGLGWGTTLLLSPTLLSVGVAWLAAAFWRYGKKVIPFATALSLVGVSILAPWAARNKALLGHPVFLRSNFGLELQTSNNELARATVEDTGKTAVYRIYHPFGSLTQAQLLRSLGEVGYNRQKLDQAIDWIRASYWKFSGLTLARFVFFWFPKTTRWWQSIVLWAVTLLAFAGWYSAKARRGTGLVLIQLVWLAYPVVLYFLHTENRYRYPLYWSLLLFAAIPVDRIRCRFIRSRVWAKLCGIRLNSNIKPERVGAMGSL